MDYKKIGEFIAMQRKEKKITQAKLAEKLYVSEKTISKWENGKGLPDANSLKGLSGIFNVSINELLNGERITDQDYISKAEEKLYELECAKVQADKHLLTMEIVIGLLSVIVLLSFNFFAALFDMANWIRVVIAVAGFLIGLIGIFFALRIEQVAGYYECAKCHYKYIPNYQQVLWAMHMNRTRYMKCPHCQKRSWQKKVLK